MTGMEQAKEFVKSGQLSAAMGHVAQDIKAHPADLRLRSFLFELLCFSGEWSRADKQLDVIGHQNVESEIAVQAYRNAIRAEQDRRRVWREGMQPHFFVEPPQYVDLQLRALRELQARDGGAWMELYATAKAQWPQLKGKLNGRDFSEFRDCHDLLGPVLEVIVRDQYAWLPLEHVTRIDMDAPKRLRDSIWVPAHIETVDGTVGQMFIPALYALSSEHQSEEIKLGRITDWQDVGDNVFEGIGLRMFFSDDSEHPILDIRNMEVCEVVRPNGLTYQGQKGSQE